MGYFEHCKVWTSIFLCMSCRSHYLHSYCLFFLGKRNIIIANSKIKPIVLFITQCSLMCLPNVFQLWQKQRLLCSWLKLTSMIFFRCVYWIQKPKCTQATPNYTTKLMLEPHAAWKHLQFSHAALKRQCHSVMSMLSNIPRSLHALCKPRHHICGTQSLFSLSLGAHSWHFFLLPPPSLAGVDVAAVPCMSVINAAEDGLRGRCQHLWKRSANKLLPGSSRNSLFL